MTVQIDTTAENNGLRLIDQGTHPSAPSAGHSLLYIVSGSAQGGLFVEDASGKKIGPYITGTPALYLSHNGQLATLSEETAPDNNGVLLYESPSGDLFRVKISSLPSGSGGNPLLLDPTNLILEDTFTGADGTNLTAHTPDIATGTWSATAGTITIQSNTAVCQAGTNDYQIDTTWNQVKVVCDIKCGEATANCAPTIIFRGTSSTKYLMVYMSGDGNGVLYFRNGSSFTSLGTFLWSADTNWHTVTVTAVGTIITIQIDSLTPMVFANIIRQAGGTICGIRGFINGGNKDSFDNFRVYCDLNETVFPSSVFPTTLYTGTFTYANGTRWNTFGWTEETGVWVVESNQGLQTGTSSPANGYVVDRQITGSYNAAIECKITTPSAGGSICGIVFRSVDKNNYVELELNTTNADTSGFALWYTNNTASFTEIGGVPFTPASNTTYTFRVRFYDDFIVAQLVEAGLVIAGYCNMFKESTKIGVFEARDGTRINPNKYDDYFVYGT